MLFEGFSIARGVLQIETNAVQMELCIIQAHRVEIFCRTGQGYVASMMEQLSHRDVVRGDTDRL